MDRSEELTLHFLKERNNLDFCNSWESLKKIVDRIARFQIIQKGLNRYTCTPKDRRTAHHLNVRTNYRAFHVLKMIQNRIEGKRTINPQHAFTSAFDVQRSMFDVS